MTGVAEVQAQIRRDLVPLMRTGKLKMPYRFMHMAEEVGECIKAWRSGRTEESFSEDGHPEGLPSELADVVIDAVLVAELLGIDLEKAVDDKLAFKIDRAQRTNE